MGTELTVLKDNDLGDMVAAFHGCGVWSAGPPPKREDSGLREYLIEMTEWREAARREVDNPCSTCPLNANDYDEKNSLFFHLCDFMILLAGRVERSAFRPVSTKAAIDEFVEIHQSCEHVHVSYDPDCQACPLNQELYKVTPFGTNVAVLAICDVFENVEPRKDLTVKAGRAHGLYDDSGHTVDESRF